MADEPDRITLLAKSFQAAALEFHRGRMAERGYRMERGVAPTVFQSIDEEGKITPAFDGETLYAVTFVKQQD